MTYEQALQTMDAAKGAAIIQAATPHNAWEGDVPAADEERVKGGQELLGIAHTAFSQGVRSAAVLDILKAAKVDITDPAAAPPATPGTPPPAQQTETTQPAPAGGMVTMVAPDGSETDVPEAAAAALEQSGYTRKQAPAPPPAPEKVKLVPPGGGDPQEFDPQVGAALTSAGWTPYAEPAATPPPAAVPPPAQGAPATPPPAQAPPPAQDSFDINAVLPGYDDMKAKDIVAAMKGIADEATFNAIQAYEGANEERKSILSAKFKPPQQAASPLVPPVGQTAPTGPIAAPAAGATDGHSAYGDSADMEAAYNSGRGGLESITADQLPEPGVGELEIKVEIDTYTDQALAQLQTRYHNADVRALALLGQQEGLRELASRMRDDSTAAAYARFLAEEKATLGDKMTASGLDGASSRAKHRAEEDESVKQWGNRVARHSAEIRNLRARQAAFEKGVARLSREQTRREKEKELGGQRG